MRRVYGRAAYCLDPLFRRVVCGVPSEPVTVYPDLIPCVAEGAWEGFSSKVLNASSLDTDLDKASVNTLHVEHTFVMSLECSPLSFPRNAFFAALRRLTHSQVGIVNLNTGQWKYLSSPVSLPVI